MNTTPTQNEAIAEANAHLTNAGLPSYEDLLDLLHRSRKLGLNFDIGTAYIRRIYIDKQTALVNEINAIPRPSQTVTN